MENHLARPRIPEICGKNALLRICSRPDCRVTSLDVCRCALPEVCLGMPHFSFRKQLLVTGEGKQGFKQRASFRYSAGPAIPKAAQSLCVFAQGPNEVFIAGKVNEKSYRYSSSGRVGSKLGLSATSSLFISMLISLSSTRMPFKCDAGMIT